jgi:hypothetical protein
MKSPPEQQKPPSKMLSIRSRINWDKPYYHHAMHCSNTGAFHQEFEDTPTHKFESKLCALDPKKQVQCHLCQAWGHNGLCYMMFTIIHIQHWVKANPKISEMQADMFA